MTVGTDWGWGGRPGICCPSFFASVTLMSTQLFYFKSRILSPASLSPSKTSFGVRWSYGYQGRKESRERASPPSIIQYLNPVPLELRKAGRKMPLPKTAAFTLCRLLAFTKEITCKLGSAGQSTIRGSNLQVITESLTNNFQNTKISFVSYLLLLKQQAPCQSSLCQ